MTTTRRRFIQSTLALSAGALAATPGAAMEPIKRVGKSRLRLSLAAYSFRNQFGLKPDEPGHIDMPRFIDYCAELGLEGTELTSYFFPKQVTGAYLADLKRRAHVAGVNISGGAIANNFTHPAGKVLDDSFAHVRTWVEHYAALGAPVIRIFAGQPPKGDSPEVAIERAVPNIERACEHAAQHGVMLAIENHDFSAKLNYMLDIVRAVKSPWFGVNLDTGNLRDTDDPYRDLALLAPYAVNVQVKAALTRSGKKEQADYTRLMKLLREANYSGYVALEYEEGDDPYKSVPKHLDQLREAMAKTA